MKRQGKKDNILKKFVISLIVLLCVFGLAAGILTANKNTVEQLSKRKFTIVTEKDVVYFINEKIPMLK